jgi:SNF2 family DNA or RNA helicase
MHARIERGRIKIALDGDEEAVLRQQEQLMANIGSHNVSEKVPNESSCALSVQNFRKLRALGCKLSEDSHTKAVVAKMLEELKDFESDTAQGAFARGGNAVFSPYEFKCPPMPHQIPGWQFLHALKEPALFGDCGTGKTFMVITFADSLIQWGQKWIFLVVCPVNLIQHVWIEDVAKFSRLRALSLRSEATKMRSSDWPVGVDRADPAVRAAAKAAAQSRHRAMLKSKFAQESDLYIINPENIRGDKNKRILELCRRKKKEGYQICLVIDESSKLKNRTSATYKALMKIRAYCERCIIMTGTPSPNGILDLWAQFSVLDGGKTIHPSFTDYRAEVAREVALRGLTYVGKGGKNVPVTKWEPRPGSAMRVYKTIEPRMIRFRTEDCIDLPERNFIIRDVEMNAEQASVYEDMENMFFAEFEGQPITAKVAAVKLLKLREVTGGFIITDEGKEVPLGKESPKMVELDELLSQSIADKMGDDGPPSKALIWAQYQWECHELVKRYSKTYGAKGLFGGISTGAKDDAIRSFKTDPKCRILVCHPGSAGHGLTLVEANYAFYYSLSYNFEEFYQSYRRISRAGQKRSMTYYFLVVPDSIDEDLIEAIREKKNLSDLITDGKFSREDLLGKRGSRPTNLSLNWEVPSASPTDLSERGTAGEDPASAP